MRKTALLILTLFIFNALWADIAVKSFRALPQDMDARVYHPVIDQNGDKCAIIKVVTTETGFYFESPSIGIFKTQQQVGEIWLYVNWGTKRITIKHPHLGVLRDYIIPITIEKEMVYEMVLTTGRVITIVEEESIESQWLVITPEPADATITIDDIVSNNMGMYQGKLKPGPYTYRVEAPMYHSEIGMLHIKDVKLDMPVKLKPNYGYVKVNSSPETDARVLIDDKFLPSNTPVTSEKLKSGEYTVKVQKDNYKPFVQQVLIEDEKTTHINAVLEPNFAELSVLSPNEASIYINGVSKGKGSVKERKPAGIYTVEAKLDKHKDDRKDVELKIGEQRVVTLQPQPIYGSVEIITNPPRATILINGKDYGTTPNTIKNLLIGEYNLQLNLANYKTVKQQLLIEESKTIDVVIDLESVKTETIAQTPKTTLSSSRSGAKPVLTAKKDKTASKGQFIIVPGVSQSLMLDKETLRLADKTPNYQLMLGYAKLMGGYLRLNTNFSSFEPDYVWDNANNGFPQDDYYLMPSDSDSKDRHNRFGFTGGMLVNIKPIVFYVGAGYGNYQHLKVHDMYSYSTYDKYKTIYLQDYATQRTYEIEGGLMLYYRSVGFQLGITTIGFEYIELSAGLSFHF